jgi:hypothetical protein
MVVVYLKTISGYLFGGTEEWYKNLIQESRAQGSIPITWLPNGQAAPLSQF